MAKRSIAKESFIVNAGPCEVPVQVFYEYRRSVRASSGKDAVLLRIPVNTNKRERAEYKEWCREWVLKQWTNNPRFRSCYTSTDYTRASSISTFDMEFDVRIQYASRKSGRVDLGAGSLDIVLPDALDTGEASDMTYSLMHKALSLHYSESITERIEELHNGRFSKPVKSISLKNMSSKWGSCSDTGKLSLSTRLLFAPKEVQDYVIIHELCHLDVLDHSNRFWRHVRSFDPDYDTKEDWLRLNGHLCDISHNMQTEITGQLELPFSFAD